jgi:tetratricopeptide (TPR) repeat protein
MNVLVLDVPLFVGELRAAGHTVVNIGPDPACERFLPGDRYTLAEIWKRLPAGFRPDRILVSESLKRRRFPVGIAGAPCPTVWYSIDGHLHLDWHRVYARLFDQVLCSQLSVCGALQAEGLRASWLPWSVPLEEMAREPHDGPRPLAVSMVGSFHAGQRPKRRQLLERLARRYPLNLFGPPFTHFLGASEQAAVYRRSGIVLNECIGGEVNFRLLEAASQGACVLSEEDAEGQSLILEPGREFVGYRGDTIEDRLEVLLSSPGLCRAIGEAGWQRVRADHTRQARCGQLLEALELTRVEIRRTLLQGVAPRLEGWVRRRAQVNGLTNPREHAGRQSLTENELRAGRVHPGPVGDELLLEQATELQKRGRRGEAEQVLADSSSDLCLLALEAGRLLQVRDARGLDTEPFVHAVQMLAQVYRSIGRRWRAGIVENPDRVLFPAWECQLLAAALKRLPGEPGLWLALAGCEFDTGRTAQAVESMDSLAQVMHRAGLALPDTLRLEYARLQWAAHLPEAAEANLLRLPRSLWADVPWLPASEHRRLERVWHLLESSAGDSADTLDATPLDGLEALALERPSSPVTGLYCELAGKRRQPARALALLERLLGREPGSARLHSLQGRLLEELGRHEEGRECSRRARECNVLVRHAEESR